MSNGTDARPGAPDAPVDDRPQTADTGTAGGERTEGEDDLRGRYTRLSADMQNLRRRAEIERAELLRFGAEPLSRSMLPVLDNLRRALAAAAAAGDPLVEGLQQVVREFEEVLAAHGVVPVETVGRPFHPGMHEAVHTEESTNLPEDTVTSELRTGYRLHDRVLRPAQVAVSRRPADGGSQDAGVSDRGR